MQRKVSRQRLVGRFFKYSSIDSISLAERELADQLKADLVRLGFEVEEDDAGRSLGGNAGNIYGIKRGNIPGESILFSAHMDTVMPGIHKIPMATESGRIVSAGETVLGADDVNGIVEILEAIECLIESDEPYRDIEVLFTVGEELYCEGAKQFDFSRVRSRDAYVLDMSGEPGFAAIKAPTILSFEISIRGKAAHAGFAPEDGINAIAVAAEAVYHTRQGMLDLNTALNIGTIAGGEASNIVSETCTCKGEIRSYSHENAMQHAESVKKNFEEAAKKYGAAVEMKTTVHIKAYEVKEQSSVVQRFYSACKNLYLQGELVNTFGGSDNNIMHQNHINGIVLSCGMQNVHTKQEYTTIEDLEKTTELLMEIMCNLVQTNDIS